MDDVQATLAGVTPEDCKDKPDPDLASFEERFEQGEDRGWTIRDADQPPFDVRIARPRVISYARFCEAAGIAPPRQIEAGVAKATFVLIHAITPFHYPGAPTGKVWGLGYESEVTDVHADTVGVEPGTLFKEVGRIGQTVRITLGAGGVFGKETEPNVSTPLPFGIPHAAFRASMRHTLDLSIELAIRVLKVHAGPFKNGGAKWNMYRQGDSIDPGQTLLQTIQVPAETRSAKVKISTWATKSRLGFRRTWTYDPIEFDLDLA